MFFGDIVISVFFPSRSRKKKTFEVFLPFFLSPPLWLCKSAVPRAGRAISRNKAFFVARSLAGPTRSCSGGGARFFFVSLTSPAGAEAGDRQARTDCSLALALALAPIVSLSQSLSMFSSETLQVQVSCARMQRKR